VFYFHGYPASRIEALTLADAAAAVGVRLIGIDRPGIGLSDPRPGFDFLDWPADVAATADRLGIGKFAVLGFSAGAPFALACALRIPHRLRACGVLSAALPPAVIRSAVHLRASLVWWAMEWIPARLFGRLVDVAMGHVLLADAETMDRVLVRRAPRQGPADCAALGEPGFRRLLAAAVVESYRQGPAANRALARALTRRWPFVLADVRCAKLFLWHGAEDRVMPVAGARRLAGMIPDCRATIYPNEGHLSPLANRGREILGVLVGALAVPASPTKCWRHDPPHPPGCRPTSLPTCAASACARAMP
jgi:pimeloyl-ACP methyl ester carboxylesterase